MKRRLFFLLAVWPGGFSLALWPGGFSLHAQELFVYTEPASNMATRSLAVRLDNTFYDMNPGYAYRLGTEVMWGASRRWMIHANGYASDMYQPQVKPEGGGLYAKYRFYANDEVHRHFRMAAFARGTWVDHPNPVSWNGKTLYSDEIDLNGTNSGYQAGVVGTQLLHKVALSASASYLARTQGPGSRQALDYSASAGLLLLPRHYNNYRQTNVNLMCEFLGSRALDKPGAFLDIGPAVQFIFNSISRLDLGYRTQLAGNMERYNQSGLFIRLEYNFLNVYR